MSKRIIFCADGTWDKVANKTNVYKIDKAIAVNADQLAFYDDGVGADGTPLEKLAGGAFGLGLYQKVMDGYTKIAHSYEKDDEIFIFGFSRGAYTARSLAGMIAICGLPTTAFDNNLVDKAFEAYRERDERQAILAGLAKYGLYDASIKMVGVWDTVGSLGIPALFGRVDPVLYGFLDTGLHPDVKNAYHALAIDERRAEFPPTLWTSQPQPDQTIEQVWFTGVHCDVGGSYPETGLSDITLSWMMQKAKNLGLVFDAGVWANYASLDPKHALDVKHESWDLLWLFPKRRTIAQDAALANSVAIRCAHDDSYRPKNLTLQNGVPAASYSIVPVVASPV
jgi:uncharacterized protein (DUF2235 family)